jgi:hypothetical protein
MDIKSIAEFIKQVGAILVALIGVGGAIIANINKVRGEKEIQRLTRELMVESSQQPSSETVPILREALRSKEQDVAQKKQKITIYIILSISFLILGMLLSLLLLRNINPLISTNTPPTSFDLTKTLPDYPTYTTKAAFTLTPSFATTSTFTTTPTFTPTAAFTPSSTFTATPTFTSSPYSCPYQGMTDNETIVGLIKAEAIASNTKDMSILQVIFDPEAVFYDYGSNPAKSWDGPRARYKDDLFITTDFKNVERFDILPVRSRISGNTAYYTSGSKGEYRTSGGAWNTFFNGSLVSDPSTKYGSEHWILKKNSNGCWVIVQMDFNAGDEKFP